MIAKKFFQTERMAPAETDIVSLTDGSATPAPPPPPAT